MHCLKDNIFCVKYSNILVINKDIAKKIEHQKPKELTSQLGRLKIYCTSVLYYVHNWKLMYNIDRYTLSQGDALDEKE